MAVEHWQLGKSALQCMGSLLTDKRWTDVSFKCRDQDPDDRDDCIWAHKVILASRSPVFEAMLYGPCASETYPLKMEEVDAEIFNLFLTYLYTDSASLTESTAPHVLQNAHMYQVTGLVEYCFKYMIKNITVETALDLLQMALFYKEKTFEGQILQFIDENADEILKCDSFLHLSKECLLLILKGNTFDASEKKIFDTAIKWAEKQCDDKGIPKDGKTVRDTLQEVFRQLRVPCMTVKEFSESTFLKGYYDLEEHERILKYITGGGDASMLPNSNQIRYPLVDEVKIVNKNLGSSDANWAIVTKLCGSAEKPVTIIGFTIDTSKIGALPGCRHCTSSCRYCSGITPSKKVEVEGKFSVSNDKIKTSSTFRKNVELDGFIDSGFPVYLKDSEFPVYLKDRITLKKEDGQFNILLDLKIVGQKIKYHELKCGSNDNFNGSSSKALKLAYGDMHGSKFNIYSIKAVIFLNVSCRNDCEESGKDDKTECAPQLVTDEGTG